MIKDKKIFITGGAGFIGSTLVERLIAHNQVVVFDNFRRNSIQSKSLEGQANLRIVKGDVLDYRGGRPRDDGRRGCGRPLCRHCRH